MALDKSNELDGKPAKQMFDGAINYAAVNIGDPLLKRFEGEFITERLDKNY
ncbi:MULTISPECIES: hypothetical protein [Flavobacteriaceae]|uniref:hypothetical protein n=1 Tax=Flavobacteriaceae TaxID=49546 RepID=UPI00234B57B9|nr:hypothetical protein [Muricauda sp. SP22]MDC6364263.1 hypothetical protein [Muricauda sp. SP22]